MGARRQGAQPLAWERPTGAVVVHRRPPAARSTSRRSRRCRAGCAAWCCGTTMNRTAPRWVAISHASAGHAGSPLWSRATRALPRPCAPACICAADAGRDRSASASGFRSSSAHSAPELRRAARAGASLAFIGPAFATASHPGASGLGLLRWLRLARAARLPVAALGGIDGAAAHRLPRCFCRGAGAIGALAVTVPPPRRTP